VLVVVVVADVVVVLLVFVETDDDDDDELLPPVPDPVDPISPHLIFEKITEVPGSFASMVDGIPAVLLQGPELPLSSQFMYPPASFQMLKIRTMPRPRASPIVVRPPSAPASESIVVQKDSVMEFAPEKPDDEDATAFAITLPF
jgi:hypothetical protein